MIEYWKRCHAPNQYYSEWKKISINLR
jgi:hypothetical protein